MTNNFTRNFGLIDDELVAGIRKSFQMEYGRQKPDNRVLDFIFGYAASYEVVDTQMLGKVEFMNN